MQSQTRIDLSPPERPARGEVDFGTVLGRVVLMVISAGLIASAFGLWLVPAAQDVPGLSLMKLGLSLAQLIAGLSLGLWARQIP